MSKLGFEFITEQSDAKFIIDDTQDGIKITLSGSLNVADPSLEFIPFYEKVHNTAIEKGFKEIVLDFTQLDFLNSSGISAFAHWVKLVKKNPGYKMKLLYTRDVSKSWQRVSLPTLAIFGKPHAEAICIEGI